MKTGRIIRSLSGYYDIQLDGTEEIQRTRARGEFRKSKQKPLVGDFVDFESDRDEGLIWAIHDRRNVLVRPPVANIDIAVIVTAVKEPNFTANLLDRQLVALEAAGVSPLIYFSKFDLLSSEEYQIMRKVVHEYRQIGYPVIESTAPNAFDQLQAELQGKVSVFMGQTGAGKSTLLNHLSPNLGLETGEVSKALSRGKHTTRQVTLIRVDDALIADTPGFSSYEVFDFSAETLDDFFPEFVAVRSNCRFRGCLHLNEPACAVKEAVTVGTISQSRYNSYKAFYQLIKAQKPKYKTDN
ncbi:ribosome small subunit-dependent GTPase A [Leuconostoc falkenbergense]|uniref:Small ribosomal subunit biogenesis GTPase RsgA n=1 Tax=Leuconostoc falkenbergense TaxID=2766470 RepID=A0A9X3IRJ2_9LACO|nr:MULTISPECIES: ribosome small subunit-dependent GTPase A [Leuconostoc]RDG18595.1 ribosome small subunit-dependent GTPase A [Leuconostoc pseudomesenteroides]MCT4377905.1 ribosome small subunit-dependent GTPase A [Leuconostoc falkenbergense]MCT4390337.1 ribosome small subunit-dependent GTPase A [Leuconostoc falkenbergense]MCT4410434.1 ribosome small subunit-dependent GTPase A [Leuconostoc falkenbergense]MCX7579490.1 ribosome small subunit-dependent GTPase A [Leuconostoc falkenbergense]